MESKLSPRLVALAVALSGAVLAGLWMAPGMAQNAADKKTSAFYFVIAHQDDEVPTWQLVDDFQHHYSIFVATTRGEGTWGCITAEEAETYPVPRDSITNDPATGAWMYEGPDSPVGETNLKERHPFGDPWQGQFKDSCAHARIASWHWFLDDMAAFDSGFPDYGISSSEGGDPWLDDDYVGEFCPNLGLYSMPNGEARRGNRPTVKRQAPNPAWSESLGCAAVWANENGARVAFDFGNGSLQQPEPFTEAEVVEAIKVLSANRGAWGIPVLPEAGLMSATPACDVHEGVPANEDDHNVVSNALYNHDFGMGPQYGAVCDGNTNSIAWGDPGTKEDSRYAAHPGEQHPTDVLEWWGMNAVNPVTSERIGPAQTNYGWLNNAEWRGTIEVMGAWDFPFRTLWKRYGDSHSTELDQQPTKGRRHR